MSGGRERELAGHPVQNNSHGYEWFLFPRIGCIFVDGDSSLNTPGAEPRRVCAVHKALTQARLAGPHTALQEGEMGYVGPVSKLRKLKSCYQD